MQCMRRTKEASPEKTGKSESAYGTLEKYSIDAVFWRNPQNKKQHQALFIVDEASRF